VQHLKKQTLQTNELYKAKTTEELATAERQNICNQRNCTTVGTNRTILYICEVVMILIGDSVGHS
jgi:hypothetical protein